MKIAIVKLSALGDIVHAMVALQFIKAYSADIYIDWIVEERFAGVLENNPDIDNILTVNLKSLKTNKTGFFQQFKKIRSYADNDYDLVIDAQGLIKSAVTAKLLGKHIAGFDADSIREKAASWFYDVKIACAYDANTIDRNVLILSRPLGIGIAPEQILSKKPFLFFKDEDPQIYDYLLKDRKNIVLVIGSTWDSRNYPPDKFVKIAEALQQNCLVVWGSEKEKADAEWMAAQSGTIKVMPRLDLNSLKALIANADLLIGNDTGPTHMAWALNRPSITIFGPTPVSRVYQTDINKVVNSASFVNPYKLNKQDYSIKDIDEQEIIEQAKLLLARNGAGFMAYLIRHPIIRILFFDTSALLKMFVNENGSENVKWLTSPDTKVCNSLQFFVNDQVCFEFEKKIRQFEKDGEISQKKADQTLDAFTNHYKNIYFKVLDKKSLLSPEKQETSIDVICGDLNLKAGKNDWDGLHYQSIIDALAFFDAESHPILVTCDGPFAEKVQSKGYRVINPMNQSRDEIQAVFVSTKD